MPKLKATMILNAIAVFLPETALTGVEKIRVLI